MRKIKGFTAGLIMCLTWASAAWAQTTDFTYQGKLVENSLPANASYDFEFRLFDGLTAGTLLSTRTRSPVTVTNGIFTVQLDFPTSLFDGTNRFLEISVRTAGSTGGYQQLLPRQPITSAPYAIRSLNATNADQATNATNAATAQNALQLGGVNASQYVLTTDSRMTDARNPLPNSANYLQNTTSQQSSSNFNISGNGLAGGTLSANAVNAATQFNLAGNRILSNAGSANLFVGEGAGSVTIGGSNSFFGRNAGLSNTTGGSNAFVGSSSGAANTTGTQNAFLGDFSGISNTTGSRNAFFGYRAGQQGTTATDNAFFGYRAGVSNTANGNSFFGASAGASNTTGNRNVFFGYLAGFANTIGNDNAFFGYLAGSSNTGINNSFFGKEAGSANTTGSDNSFFGYLAGNTNTDGNFNSFFGKESGRSITSGGSNSFVGLAAGSLNTTGDNNSFFGALAGNANTTGDNNTIIGVSADVASANLNFATAIGAGAVVSSSNTIVLGRSSDDVLVPGSIAVVQLGSGGSTDVCRNAANFLSTCSSSLRYKTSVQPFSGGLNLVNGLRPITFNWRDGGMRDVGFAAEGVEKVEPLFVTYNDRGEIEGVKYGQLTTVLVNAVQQQQQTIERQQRQIDALKKLACLQNPLAEICKEEQPK